MLYIKIMNVWRLTACWFVVDSIAIEGERAVSSVNADRYRSEFEDSCLQCHNITTGHVCVAAHLRHQR